MWTHYEIRKILILLNLGRGGFGLPFPLYIGGKGTMKTYFTLNNRRYEAREFDFNLICDLQEMGINILDMASMRNNPVTAIRAYASLCIGADKETAGEEIQAHVINGGGFDEILEAIRNGHIAYIINTRKVGDHVQANDGALIRQCASENNATLFTSLDTVRVLLDVLEETTQTISTIDA